MISLTHLPKSVAKKVRHVGRGFGSGRGKTAGRGTKGQKARGTIPVSFEGGQLSLMKRLPLYRGKSRNKKRFEKIRVINIQALNVIPQDTEVTREILVKYHMVAKDHLERVKILGNGVLKHALTICLPISNAAKVKIEAAGGKIKPELEVQIKSK